MGNRCFIGNYDNITMHCARIFMRAFCISGPEGKGGKEGKAECSGGKAGHPEGEPWAGGKALGAGLGSHQGFMED